MHIPGHLAVALLEHYLFSEPAQRQATFKPLIVASLFPDLIDKSAGYLFGMMPNGRHYTHNIFSVLLLTGFVWLLFGRTAGYGWFLGHLGHLIMDRRSMIPWFYPLRRYTFYRGHLQLLKPKRLAHEALLLALVLLVYLRPPRG